MFPRNLCCSFIVQRIVSVQMSQSQKLERRMRDESEKKNKMFIHREHDDVNINDSIAKSIGIWPCAEYFLFVRLSVFLIINNSSQKILNRFQFIRRA